LNRRSLIIVALALLATFDMAAKPWLKKVDEAQKAAKAKNQLILVDMFAEWCGWCHRFEREVFPSEAFQEATTDIVLLRLNTEDGGEGSQYARRFGVSSLPTFLVLTPDLTLAGMIRGYLPPAPFVQALKETRTKHQAFEERLRNEAKLDAAGRLELAKELSIRMAFDQAEKRFTDLINGKATPAPVRDDAYFQLASIQLNQKKLEDAKKTLRKLTSMSTKGEPVERGRLMLAQIYYEQGNYLSAATELRNFKKSYPNSPFLGNVDMFLPTVEKKLSGQ
jgi:thioredoxin-related protein